jgi:hypothetical protein
MLEDKGLHLGAGHDPVDAMGLGDHLSRSRMQIVRILEIRGHPTPERSSFSDIQDSPTVVEELIAAG